MIYVGVFFLGGVFGIVLMYIVSGCRKSEEKPTFEPICIRQENLKIETIKAVQIINKEAPYPNQALWEQIKFRVLTDLIDYADKIGAITYETYEDDSFLDNRRTRIEAQLMVGVKR